MKVKKYNEFINESLNRTFEEIVNGFCKLHNIENFKINENNTVDVFKTVNLQDKYVVNLPFKFGIIHGDFRINNTWMTNLNNSPEVVMGEFLCGWNKITSLIGSPKKVVKGYNCEHTEITTLEGITQDIGGDLRCSNCKLINFIDLPKIPNNKIRLEYNEASLTSLDGLPLNWPIDRFTSDRFTSGRYVSKMEKIIWNWLETNLFLDQDILKYHIEWIKEHRNSMTESFKENFGYLIEINDYM